MIRTKLQLFWLLLMGLLVIPAYAQQPLLQITSPSNLSLATEGQILTITISADPSVQNIFIAGQSPLPPVQPTSNSNQFTLTLPTNITPGWYQLGAVGSAPSGYVESAPVLIDVERSDAPVSITVQPTFFTVQGIGSQTPIPIYGTYADGTNLYLSNSTQTGLVSANTTIATVSGATSSGPGIATATAVGAGETSVVVSTYATGSQTASATATIWVTVTLPPTGPAPVITSVSTNTGTPGVTQVTVNGSNFGSAQGSGYLELGNKSATSISLWTPGQIIATVPLGSMPGVVLVKQNGLASNSLPFTTVVPSITGLNQTSGTTGTPITISGSNFGGTQNGSQIMFNHVAATPTTWTDGSIVAPVPVGATTGTIVVIVNGSYSNAVNFTVPPPAIKTLSPARGAIGATVTIKGSNFAGAQNTSTVTFNGIHANPSVWGDTSITVKVPSGATTGPVVVTVNGVASNGATFWVNNTSDFNGTLTVPAIGTTGTATQVPTSGNLAAGQNASLTFTGTTGQALSFNFLNSTIGSSASNCIATLYDPSNNSIGTGYCGVQTAGGWMGPMPLTATGLYRLYLVPNGGATGSVSVSVNNDSDVTTPAISIGGAAVTPTTVIAGQDVRLKFTATAAQHIGVYATSVTNPSASLNVLSASGTVLASTSINNNPAGQTFFVDTQLTSAGTYQLLIQHASKNFGSETLQIVTAPNDFTGSLAVPAAGKTGATTQVPTSGNLAVGQNAKLTFKGTAGQKLSFNISNSTIGTSASSCLVTISDPSKNVVWSGYCGTGASYIDTLAIATTGTYTFYIAPQGGVTGSVGISVNNDQDATTPAITVGGSAVTATSLVPGQDVRLSFTTTGPQHILVSATNVTNPRATLSVLSPTGSVLGSTSITNNPSGQTFTVDTQLGAAGTYQLLVQHSSAGIGSETLQIAGGPADFTGTLTVPTPGTIGAATQVPTTGSLATRQNASLTFSGTGGQRLSFNVSNSTIGTSLTSCRVTIYDPSRNVAGSGYCGTGASYVDTISLPATGTYSFYIAPQGAATGSVSISVNNDQDVTVPAITIGGSAVTVASKVAGQDVRLSFNATAAQNIVVTATNVTNPSATLNVVAPSGMTMSSTSISSGQTFTVEAPLIGSQTYQIWVQHSSTNIGSETLQITSVPNDFAGTLTVPAAGTTGPVTQVPTTGNLASGQNASLTFNGTAGQKLSFNVLNSTIGTAYYSCLVTIYDPSLNVVGSGYCGKGTNFIDTITLASTGTYTFYMNAQAFTGNAAVSVNNDADVTTPAITIGGSAVTTTTTVAGQDVRLSFTVTAAQHISVTATNVTNPSATLRVVSPSGSTLVSTPVNNNPSGQTFFVDTQLSGAGTYQLWVQHSSTNIGSETLQIGVVPPDFTGTLTVPAAGTTGPVTQVPTTGSLAPAQNASLTFSGTSGQKLSFNVVDSTIGTSSSSCIVTIYDPNHKSIESGNCGKGATFVNTVTLAATGAFTFYIDPQGAVTGSVGISINNDSDFTGTLTVPSTTGTGPVTQVPTSGNLLPGQNASLTFSGTSGQKLSFNVVNSTIGTFSSSCTVTIYDPTHTSVGSGNCGTGATFVNSVTLASTGTYTFYITPQGGATGSVGISVNNVSDFTGTLTVPSTAGTTGPVTQVPTSGTLLPGENASLTFSGTAGQKLSFNVVNSTIGTSSSSCVVTIYDPSRTSVGSGNCGTGATFVNSVTLASTGTYTFYIAPQGGATGSVGISVNNVSDFTATLTVPAAGQTGPAVQVPTTGNLAPGQDASLTFSGSTGQTLSFSMANSTIGSDYYYCGATLYDPNNNSVATGWCGRNSNIFGTVTLASTGTYTLRLVPGTGVTGSVSVSVNNDQPVTAPISIGGSPVTVTTTVALQNANLPFSGTANQIITVLMSNDTFPGCSVTQAGVNVTVFNPDGTKLVSYSCLGNGDLPRITLPQTGTYTLNLSPGAWNYTGSMTFTLDNVVDVNTTITPGGPPVTVTTNTVGQHANLTFTGSPNQRVALNLTNGTYPGCGIFTSGITVKIYNPDGSILAQAGCLGTPYFFDTMTLSQTGTYTITVDPNPYTGSVTLTLYSVPADVSGSITIGGTGFTFTTVVGQNANITFSNPQTQTVTLHWSAGTYSSCNLTVTNSSNTQVGSAGCQGATGSLSLSNLPSGAYNIFVNPGGTSTGGLTISATSP
ncbi:MAG TPA: IPT/TIG domain-containing protein [Terriglobales bacterium]|nr:IPT/TIG domain-containing protein [Terriglobales bacterium]